MARSILLPGAIGKAHSSVMAPQTGDLIPTRASLLNRLKDLQDQSSWQEFFDTYWKLIYGIARKTGMTDAEAQDVVQETMMSVVKNMPRFRYNPAIGSFKAWLLKLTRWRIIDQIRKRPPPALHRPLCDNATGTGTAECIIDPRTNLLDQLWDAEWEKNLFDAALANVKRKLDPRKHQIYDFYVNKDWPPEKVAARFQISVSQVHMAKHRITKLIKSEVARLKKRYPLG